MGKKMYGHIVDFFLPTKKDEHDMCRKTDAAGNHCVKPVKSASLTNTAFFSSVCVCIHTCKHTHMHICI